MPCQKPVSLSDGEHNAWVYNTIFVPKITWFSLGDATISSKRDSSNSRKEDERSYVKVRAMLKSCHLFEFFILNNILHY